MNAAHHRAADRLPHVAPTTSRLQGRRGARRASRRRPRAGHQGGIKHAIAPRRTRQGGQTTVHVQRFTVAYDIPVYFTERLFAPDNPVLAEALTRLEPDRRHRCLVFVDDGLLAARPGWPTRSPLTPRITTGAWSWSARRSGSRRREDQERAVLRRADAAPGVRAHIDRHSFVIAIGGGAVLDAVGLVAATTHRGVRLIRVPTTVLAQDDSGVGVKNGVNPFGQKNFVGTFAPPFAVLNDLDLLDTLSPARQDRGHGRSGEGGADPRRRVLRLARAQRRRPRRVRAAGDGRLIRRCAELHMRQIAHGGDPFETGSARPLDFGHWAAHKLESLTRHHLRHGEAVAIGIALDARYSVRAGLLAAGAEERVCGLLEHLGFRAGIEALDGRRPDGAARPRRAARVPRASGRRAHRPLLEGDRPRRRGARDGRGADRQP